MIDPKAGIVLKKKVGDQVGINDTLAIIYTDKGEILDRAVRELESCIHLTDAAVARRSVILAYVDRDSVKPWVAARSH